MAATGPLKIPLWSDLSCPGFYANRLPLPLLPTPLSYLTILPFLPLSLLSRSPSLLFTTFLVSTIFAPRNFPFQPELFVNPENAHSTINFASNPRQRKGISRTIGRHLFALGCIALLHPLPQWEESYQSFPILSLISRPCDLVSTARRYIPDKLLGTGPRIQEFQVIKSQL